MFPDLTCDDVFRLETKRLWLRWPRAADAAAIGEFAAKADVAQMTAEIPHPYPPREAERFIFKARAENAAGLALHFALTQKTAARAVVGVASAHAGENQSVEIGFAVAPQLLGQGLRNRGGSRLDRPDFQRHAGPACRRQLAGWQHGLAPCSGKMRPHLCWRRARISAGAGWSLSLPPFRTRPCELAPRLPIAAPAADGSAASRSHRNQRCGGRGSSGAKGSCATMLIIARQLY